MKTDAPTSKKTLLFFAHKKEAQAFLAGGQGDPWRPWSPLSTAQGFGFLGYESSDYYLCVAGEGLDRTFFVASSVLATCSSEVGACVNLGIAGGLRPEHVKVGEVFSVRNAYRHEGQKPSFKSFGCSRVSGLPYADCISTKGAVSNQKARHEVGHFAHLVDQELWALAYVASEHKLPLASLKVVSDVADGEASSIRARSKAFSEALQSAFNKHLVPTQNDLSKPSTSSGRGQNFFAEHFPFLGELHITRTQWEGLPGLFREWLQSQGESARLHPEEFLRAHHVLKNICLSSLTPKKKTKALMDFFRTELDPYLAEASRSLQSLRERYNRHGVRVEFDEQMRHGRVRVAIEAASEAEWNEAARQVQSIRFGDIESILKGSRTTPSGRHRED